MLDLDECPDSPVFHSSKYIRTECARLLIGKRTDFTNRSVDLSRIVYYEDPFFHISHTFWHEMTYACLSILLRDSPESLRIFGVYEIDAELERNGPKEKQKVLLLGTNLKYWENMHFIVYDIHPVSLPL